MHKSQKIKGFQRETYVALRKQFESLKSDLFKIRINLAGIEYALLTAEMRGVDNCILTLEGAYYGDN